MLPILAFLFTIAQYVYLYSHPQSVNDMLEYCGLIGISFQHHIVNVIAGVVGAVIIFSGIVFGWPLCITYGVVLLVPMAICNCLAIFMFYSDKIINAKSLMLVFLGVMQLGIILSIVNATRNVQLLGYVIVITSIVYTVDDHNQFAVRFVDEIRINERIQLGLRILQFIAAVCILTSIGFGSIIILKLGMIVSLPFVIYGLLKQPFMYDIKNFHLHIYMLSIVLDSLFG